MKEKVVKNIAEAFFQKPWSDLSELEKRVIQSVIHRKKLSRDLSKNENDTRSFGERVADGVAAFGGSWTFIGIFTAVLVLWVILNSVILVRYGSDFDPYPYILLNLFLSMLAAVQAPIIMMSQNRQAARDRADAEHDYEVNLKSEIEILGLHKKIDELCEHKWESLLEVQQRQIEMLESLLTDTDAKK